MAIKQFNVSFQDLPKEQSFRYDVDYLSFQNEFSHNEYYTFNDLFEFKKSQKVDITDLDNFAYAEIGNVTKFGEVVPVQLNFNERNEETDNYYSKIEKGDIIKADLGDILVSKVRPNLRKVVLINSQNIEAYFTAAFFQLRPKQNNKLLYYGLRTFFYHNINSIARQGKGYPTLKEDDFRYLKFEKQLIDYLAKNEKKILSRIEPLEEKIQKLQSTLIPAQTIINEIIAKEFKFTLENVYAVENIKSFHVSNLLSTKNFNLRSSVRWHKIAPIQKEMYKNIECIQKLGLFIKSIKNGWSPSCKESDTLYNVFNVSSISQNAVINFDELKSTDETRDNIKDYICKQGDFYVSRGNTVDLVALASIAETVDEDKTIIYPDLFIKVEFDETKIDKKYISYLFNSVVGRLYFKYAAKGKNQTMVKISKVELEGFYLPIPSLAEQKRIANKIKIELDKQENIKNQIIQERVNIDKIIEDCIRTAN